MSRIFVSVFNLSIAASWLIGAVMILRLLLKNKAPKWISCLLWAVVGLRLVIPFYFESNLSLVPSRETLNPEAVYGESAPAESQPSAESQPPADAFQSDAPIYDISASVPPAVGNVDEALPDTENKKPTEYVHSGFAALDERVNEAINEAADETADEHALQAEAPNPVRRFADIASIIWACGMVAMVIYAVINYAVLKRRVAVFVPEEGNIRRSENVGSPFILGFISPKIYLPFGLSSESEKHIIAHERAHLKRRDHWIKPLGYAILTVYWFNPLVWLAYILLCRDIEYACDEKVVKNLDAEARKAYASALLECGVKRSFVSACPVAFGEIGVKDRVKNALSYKKPLLWIIIAAVVICAVTAIAFFAVPNDGEDDSSGTSSEITDDTSVDTSDDVSDSIVTRDLKYKLLDFDAPHEGESLRAKIRELSFAEGADENSPIVIDSIERAILFSACYSRQGYEIVTFLNNLSEEYFEGNIILYNDFYSPDTSRFYYVKGVRAGENVVTVDYGCTTLPVGDFAETYRYFFIEIKKSDVLGIDSFNAAIEMEDNTNNVGFNELQYSAWPNEYEFYETPFVQTSVKPWTYIIRSRADFEAMLEIYKDYEAWDLPRASDDIYNAEAQYTDEYFSNKAWVVVGIGSTCSETTFEIESLALCGDTIYVTIGHTTLSHNAVLQMKLVTAEVDKADIASAESIITNVVERKPSGGADPENATERISFNPYYCDAGFYDEVPLATECTEFETFVITNNDEFKSFVSKIPYYEDSEFYKSFASVKINDDYFGTKALVIAYVVSPNAPAAVELQSLIRNGNTATLTVGYARFPDSFELADEIDTRLAIAEIGASRLNGVAAVRAVKEDLNTQYPYNLPAVPDIYEKVNLNALKNLNGGLGYSASEIAGMTSAELKENIFDPAFEIYEEFAGLGQMATSNKRTEFIAGGGNTPNSLRIEYRCAVIDPRYPTFDSWVAEVRKYFAPNVAFELFDRGYFTEYNNVFYAHDGVSGANLDYHTTRFEVVASRDTEITIRGTSLYFLKEEYQRLPESELRDEYFYTEAFDYVLVKEEGGWAFSQFELPY